MLLRLKINRPNVPAVGLFRKRPFQKNLNSRAIESPRILQGGNRPMRAGTIDTDRQVDILVVLNETQSHLWNAPSQPGDAMKAEPSEPSSPQESRPDVPRTIQSEELFAGQRVLMIEHAGQCYRLLITRNERLILQKQTALFLDDALYAIATTVRAAYRICIRDPDRELLRP
jgi:hemin uptake protein HemP